MLVFIFVLLLKAWVGWGGGEFWRGIGRHGCIQSLWYLLVAFARREVGIYGSVSIWPLGRSKDLHDSLEAWGSIHS